MNLFNKYFFYFIDYGDTCVEYVGPRYGPMSGEEILFINFKGRVIKDDIRVIITDQATKWSEEIKQLTMNGNFIHFQMLPFPSRQMTRANVIINIYHKNQLIHQAMYLYTNLLDRMQIFPFLTLISIMYSFPFSFQRN